MKTSLSKLLLDESGQDIIEYALLTGIIGISAALVVPSIQTKLGTAFSRGGSALYNHAQANWVPKPPQ